MRNAEDIQGDLDRLAAAVCDMRHAQRNLARLGPGSKPARTKAERAEAAVDKLLNQLAANTLF